MVKLTEKQIDDIQQSLDCGMKCYVNKKTGKVLETLDFDEYGASDFEDDWADTLKEIEDNWDDFIELEKMSSRDGFMVMESFVDEVSNRNVRERLIQALNGRKPFRNFKDQVDNAGDVREQWFAHKAKQYTRYVRKRLQYDFELPELKEKKKVPPKINFDGKTLLLIENSDKGEVNSDTVFEFSQNYDLVTADYEGGTIRYGNITGHLKEDKLEMVYQCITHKNRLRSGKGTGIVKLDDDGKIRMKIAWEWLDDKGAKGISEYIQK